VPYGGLPARNGFSGFSGEALSKARAAQIRLCSSFVTPCMYTANETPP